MLGNTLLIIRREYLERVRRKSFIFTTIAMPLLMIALMVIPALIMAFSNESKTIAVIDASGIIAPALQNSDDIAFESVDITPDQAKANEDYDAVLVIGRNIIDDNSDITLFTHSSSTMNTDMFITDQVSKVIENERLKAYNIENLSKILEEVKPDVHLATFKIGEGSEEETSAIASYGVAMIMMLLLYTFIMLYGQMVMTSIIEEKNNRVLEVVVSSTKPTQLMLGKILGIGAVAVTQILIWAILLFVFTMWGLPAITASAAQDMGDSPEFMAMLNSVASPGFIAQIFLWMTLFLIGGYLFYAAIYAAIGSAVDNIQDASQLQSLAMVPIIIGLVLSMSVVNDPTSSLSMWVSMIPFTSPMGMMARIPFGVPLWQILLSVVILYLSVLFMVWLTAKIYRVGIFMYGKKPTAKELLRWARYK